MTGGTNSQFFARKDNAEKAPGVSSTYGERSKAVWSNTTFSGVARPRWDLNFNALMCFGRVVESVGFPHRFSRPVRSLLAGRWHTTNITHALVRVRRCVRAAWVPRRGLRRATLADAHLALVPARRYIMYLDERDSAAQKGARDEPGRMGGRIIEPSELTKSTPI